MGVTYPPPPPASHSSDRFVNEDASPSRGSDFYLTAALHIGRSNDTELYERNPTHANMYSVAEHTFTPVSLLIFTALMMKRQMEINGWKTQNLQRIKNLHRNINRKMWS